MSINKTQQFLYFQNKAKHYDIIKNIKSSVNDKLEPKYLRTLSFSQREKDEKSPQNKRRRLIPLIKEIQIKQNNQKMISRLLQLHKSSRTEVEIQGNYSRFNYQERKFRSTNPYKDQLNRTIQIGNNQLKERLKKAKPRVGNSLEWNKHFGKTLELKKNMSRYLLQSNRSKGSLHISLVDSYVPKYFETFLNTPSVIQLGQQENKPLPKQIQITHEALLVLPDIKSKQSQPFHSIRQTKDHKKLIFDSSKSNLNDSNKKSTISLEFQSSQQQQQAKKLVENQNKKQKRKLLQFKFAQVNSESNRVKQKAQRIKNQLNETLQNDSTLKFQKSEKDEGVNLNFSSEKKEEKNEENPEIKRHSEMVEN